MKHTIKLLPLTFTLVTILTLTGCPGPVTPDKPCTHEHTKTEVVEEATCTEDGLGKIVCVDCEEVIEEQVEIDALGHDFGEWSVTTPETCTTNGSKRRVCSRCGYEEIETILAHHHVDYETSGYCETCEEYKFENRFTVRVYTSKDEFIKDISTYSVGLSSNNENNSPYDECKFSFESENPSMTVDTLIHKKLRYLNYNVVGYKVKEQDTPISIMEYEEIFEESINRIYSILIEPQIN